MKKKINIVLLVLVLTLWGTVIYRYVSQYFSKDELLSSSQSNSNFSNLNIKSKDTFELVPLHRDPFLNKEYYTESKPKPISLPYKPATSKAKPSIQITANKTFPAVNYLGYIKPEKGVELVLIKVNGTLLKLKNNESKEGIKVLQIFKDSIKVSYEGEAKIIRK